MNDNMYFHYEQHCKTWVVTSKRIKDIINDGVFTKLIGYNGELLYARKNRVNTANMQKGFSIGNIK